jgi:hypothetical protein
VANPGRGSSTGEAITSPPATVVRRPLDVDAPLVRAAPGGRLADGLVVDASIVARLLGLRLLTLDARIRFVPTHFTTAAPPGPSALDRISGSSGDLGLGSTRPWSLPGRLADAVDLLADASRTLDRIRQDLPTSLPAAPG